MDEVHDLWFDHTVHKSDQEIIEVTGPPGIKNVEHGTFGGAHDELGRTQATLNGWELPDVATADDVLDFVFRKLGLKPSF